MPLNTTPPPSNPSARTVTVDAEHDGQRIDNFLLAMLKGAPRTLVYRILRSGEVRVNSGRIKPSYRVEQGDVVRIPPIRLAPAKIDPEVPPAAEQRIKDCIIFEDGDLIVFNKPSGMAVHGGSGISHGVIESLRVIMPLTKRLELVHRLDRDTSGCLLIAKKASVLKSLHDQMRDGTTEKIYLALVKGETDVAHWDVTAPLVKNVASSGERVVRVREDGKESHTIFSPRQRFNGATLVEAKLLTGRTHQIRVHGTHSGHPLAGDEKYGDAQFNKDMRTLGLKRLFLHARTLTFKHPGTGKDYTANAPLPRELSEFLKKL